MVTLMVLIGGFVIGATLFVAGGGIDVGPESWFILSALPLVGMAVIAESQGVREALGQSRNGNGMGSPGPSQRRPLSDYLMFVSCGSFEFVAGLGHGAVYHEVIQFGKSMFLARVPVIGEVVKAIYPQLSLQGLAVLFMTMLVVVSPILFFRMIISMGIWDQGLKAIHGVPMAKVKLGIPLGLYLAAFATEGYMLWKRFKMEGKPGVFVDPYAIALDPVSLGVVAVLTFSLTTLVGFWTASKLEAFQKL